MPNRYSYTRTLKEADTKRSYMESTIYPKIIPEDSDLYIITESSDRLDLLAKKYYDDITMWWVIAVANNINDGNFYVESGRQLRIPVNVSKIASDLQKINK
jgi:hypothetical protein